MEQTSLCILSAMRSTTRSSLDCTEPRAPITSWRPVRISLAETAAEVGMAERYQMAARRAISLTAAFERCGRLVDQLLDDRGDGLFPVDHAHRLASHDGARLDIAIDHGAAQGPGPIMLDLELRLGHLDRALVEQVGDLALLGREIDHLLILERTHRNDGQSRVDLHGGDGIARRSPDESLLEIRVGDAFVGADETGAELDADRAHFQIGRDGFPAADAAGNEHGDVLAHDR